MKNKKELPLIEPIYSTYHSGIFSACIIENPTIRNLYLNEVMILTCTTRFLTGYTTPEISIEGTSMKDITYLDKQWVEMRFVKGQISYVIRNMIDEGYYVYFWGVDDYYVDGKSWYKERHFNHDGAICGYDQNNKSYCIYAYDKNWIYQKFWVPQKSFELGRKAMFEKDVHGFLCGLKPKMVKIEFSSVKALEKIKEYLEFNQAKDIRSKDCKVRGIIVHDYIAKYIGKLYDGSIPYEKMDWRIFRVIWEQKKIMLERIQMIEKDLNLKANISEKYSCLVDEADSIRMSYAFYHVKRRDSILLNIQNKLDMLKNKEFELLNELISTTNNLLEHKTGEI